MVATGLANAVIEASNDAPSASIANISSAGLIFLAWIERDLGYLQVIVILVHPVQR